MVDQEEKGSVPSLRMIEVVFALICILFSIFLMIGSVKLGANWTPEGPESGYFPFYIFLMMFISSSAIFYESLFINKKNSEEPFVQKIAFTRSPQLETSTACAFLAFGLLVPFGPSVIANQ